MNDLICREQLMNKLNSTGTNITFDIPVEEILGENVDLDDFAALMQDAIQAYRKMVIDTIKNMSTAYDANKAAEQGRLIKLPCSIGDDVYFVPSETNYRLNILNHHSEENKIYNQKVARITFSQNGWYLECDKDLEYAMDHILQDKMYKETWFLTRSEAETKLKELEDKNNE
mgnify:CR=1 FL=1